MDHIEIIGATIGLLYLFLQYKTSVWLWPVSIIMSIFYISIFYGAKIYADMALSIYYLIVAIYGLIIWMSKRKNSTQKGLPITHIKAKISIILTILFIFLYFIIYYLLSTLTDSTVPMCDSFTTSLSVVGMIMLARKYAEHWIVWVIVDAASVGLYIYKDLTPTAILYSIYTIVAIFGYFHWKNKIGE